jgi:hypothetical protein
MTLTYRAVRTKTGTKVHIAGLGSSRTYCGAKVARTLTSISRSAQPCGGCGMPPEMTPETMAQWLGLPLKI